MKVDSYSFQLQKPANGWTQLNRRDLNSEASLSVMEQVYFVVMSNILKSDQYIHLCYDLKGSSQGRSINKVEIDQKTVLKDADLDFCFYLEPLIRVRLLA